MKTGPLSWELDGLIFYTLMSYKTFFVIPIINNERFLNKWATALHIFTKGS